jgi:IS30 family transposase
LKNTLGFRFTRFLIGQESRPDVIWLLLDHGGEFAGHTAVVAALGRLDSVFFARPYRACDKGSVEQLNGLIRRRYPKRSDFRTVPQVDLDALRNHLNGCPMHVTGGQAPITFLDQLLKSS